MSLSDRQRELLEDLQAIRDHLNAETLGRYQRLNPLMENLVDWRERALAWTGTDKHVTVYDSTTIVGDVQIGEGTWIGPFCSLDGGGGLRIGAYCSVSAGVQLLTHDTIRWALSGGEAPYEYAPTVIGDRCFIGTHAIVTKGVTVGEHCVIGAGAVVTRDGSAR